jgi:hypothetical protein
MEAKVIVETYCCTATRAHHNSASDQESEPSPEWPQRMKQLKAELQAIQALGEELRVEPPPQLHSIFRNLQTTISGTRAWRGPCMGQVSQWGSCQAQAGSWCTSLHANCRVSISINICNFLFTVIKIWIWIFTAWPQWGSEVSVQLIRENTHCSDCQFNHCVYRSSVFCVWNQKMQICIFYCWSAVFGKSLYTFRSHDNLWIDTCSFPFVFPLSSVISLECMLQGADAVRQVRTHCWSHLIPAMLLSFVSTSRRNESWSRVMGKICIPGSYTTHINPAFRPSLLY